MPTRPVPSNDPHAPAVVFTDVCKRYKKQTVLQQISFAVAPAQSVAVVGLNGAGKTTMLRALLGFVSIDSGSISLFGQSAACGQARRSVVFLPERLMLAPDLSGWRSLQTYLWMLGVSADRERCEQALDDLGFPLSKLDAPARTYSKGMCQKIGLAGAICSNAKLAILDEPLSGLDPLARRAMDRTMMQWRAGGTGLLFTAHSLDGLEALCDRILVIHLGQIRFFGPPAQLLAQATSSQSPGSLEQAFLNLVAMPQEIS